MLNPNLEKLSNLGVSVWLDDLNRSMLNEGRLKNLISNYGVVGLTTNPSIFAEAITKDASYAHDLKKFASESVETSKALEELMVQDVQVACDLFKSIFNNTDGRDGRVSIEVEPALAHDSSATVGRAAELWQKIARNNVMIKIPATTAGLEAITETVARGISVNVTLIFSIERYRQVVSAYMHGLEKALNSGTDITKIHSVASVFVSRFDTAVSAEAQSNETLKAVDNKIGVANAKLIYDAAIDAWSTERARYLLDLGANTQRLLWASTGVKSEQLAQTHYVKELTAKDTINTMPLNTLEAVAENFDATAESISQGLHEAALDMQLMTNNGLDYKELTKQLESEGLDKFSSAWDELVESVKSRLNGM